MAFFAPPRDILFVFGCYIRRPSTVVRRPKKNTATGCPIAVCTT